MVLKDFVKGGLKLAFVNSIKISFCPIWSTPGIRELVQRTTTKKAVSSNPKCKVEVDVLDADGVWGKVPNIVTVNYADGSVDNIEAVPGLHVDEIVGRIMIRTHGLERAKDLEDMMKNPVTDPRRPIGSFKGKNGRPFAIYAKGSEETSKRAAGGVKTIKKK